MANSNGTNVVEDFVNKLRSQMEKKGMSIAELARVAGIGRPYLHRVLSGEQQPSFEWAEKVGGIVGIKIKLTCSAK